jgi:hypothetical protein
MNTIMRAAQCFTRAVAIEIHCRRCARSFVPSSDAIRSGPEVYRFCLSVGRPSLRARSRRCIADA